MQITIASGVGLFSAFAISSPLQGDFAVSLESPVGTFRYPDGTIAQDIIGGITATRQTFKFHWPQMSAIEYSALVNAVKVGPPWNIYPPMVWDNVNGNGQTLLNGQVTAVTSASAFTTNLTGYEPNYWKNATLTFNANPRLADGPRLVTTFAYATGAVTTQAFNAPPSVGDLFNIVGPAQYFVCLFDPNSLRTPFNNRPPFNGPVADVTFMVTEIGRGP